MIPKLNDFFWSLAMSRILASTAVLIALSAPAFATGHVAPVPVPVPASAGTDWTGFYAGLGYGHITWEEPGFEDESTQYSFFGGYLHDFGNVVVGVELDYMIADNWDVSVGDEDSLTSLTVRVGYDLGRVLPYVSLGIGTYDSIAFAESDMLTLIGVGADFQMTDNIRLGVIYEAGMNGEFDDGFSAYDLDVNTLSLRVMYNF